MGLAALVILVAGNVLGYPALTVILLWSGVTVLRRESRSLGNALALLGGAALVVLPAALRWLEPTGVVRDDAEYLSRYGLHLAATLFVGYFGFCFSVFLVASLLYRWRPVRLTPEAVVVLGAGLVNDQVPPLLAGRLDQGWEAQRRYGAPLLITSGGQGDDEPVPEGRAMRDYLIDRGAEPDRVIAETASRNTAENLELSRALLSDPHAPVLVVTSSYHVFRAALLTRQLGMRAHVIGSGTAWYFLPSAVIREFIGILRDQLRFHVAAVGAILAVSVMAVAFVAAMAAPQ
ncbi:YdcF family protein [Nesterenkonia pannonica]|uniref:YdcF family protein n=1 Tax=Nesterenkonia pannonica TaxID=1548602 RepID=UPI002164BAFF|nr:YdcF family protein [Nesterenkonia pannonica]